MCVHLGLFIILAEAPSGARDHREKFVQFIKLIGCHIKCQLQLQVELQCEL